MMLGYCLNAISSKAQHKVVITQALILAKKKGEVGTALRPGLFQWFGSGVLLSMAKGFGAKQEEKLGYVLVLLQRSERLCGSAIY